MAMSDAVLAEALKTALVGELSPLYSNISDDHTLPLYDLDSYLSLWSETVARVVVAFIQANARAQGTDSHGDSHDLSIV